MLFLDTLFAPAQDRDTPGGVTHTPGDQVEIAATAPGRQVDGWRMRGTLRPDGPASGR